MTYTINGKPHTEFDINKRCAELMGVAVLIGKWKTVDYLMLECGFSDYNPCNDPSDTDAIIDKCWDELMCTVTDWNDVNIPKWECLIEKHNCTKLIAACICLIEMEGEHERQ
tara:strand:- start:1898 stop:2233 length:336 start_codon:yes stop_codon:yes gene_type:complete